MTDDESSFRRRRRREGDSGDAARSGSAEAGTPDTDAPDTGSTDTDSVDTGSTALEPTVDEPAADVTPWWRATGLTADGEPGIERNASEDSDDAPRLRRSSFQPVQSQPDDAPDDEAGAAATGPDRGPTADRDATPEAESTADAGSTPDAVSLSETAVLPDLLSAPEPVRASEPVRPPESVTAPEPVSASNPLRTPEPHIAPEPVSARAAQPENATENQLDDEPMPPLFKPRPDADRPWVTRPYDAPVDAGIQSAGGAEGPGTIGPPAIGTPGAPSADTGDNESAPFVWSLTPNDELDPIVHATSSDGVDDAPAVEPEQLEQSWLSPDRDETGDLDSDGIEFTDLDSADVDYADVDYADLDLTDLDSDDLQPTALDPVNSEPVHTRPIDAEDAASLAFLMELEAAAAATSAADDDSAGEIRADEGSVGGAPTEALDSSRRPVSAASVPVADFSDATELFPSVAADASAPGWSAPGAGTSRTGGSGSGRPPLPPAVKWIALGLAALLVLVALFFLGTRLPGLFGASAPATPAPTATATPTPTPTPTETPTPTAPPAEAVAIGPLAPGEHKWSALLGGECLEPYSTPWAETFTVVDCAAPHTAQMVFTAPITSDPAAPYPGEAEIASELALWCSAPGVFDSAAAAAYSDLQVQGTYPVNAEQWASGERTYSCFLSRSSGEALTGTLAIAQPAT